MGGENPILNSSIVGDAYRSYPEVIWTYQPVSDPQSSRLMDTVFRQWSRAHRHGLKVRDVSLFGRSLTDRVVERCNLFMHSGGTVEASKLHHWDAVKFFDKEILRSREK
jgi:hypothetical protein